MAEKVFCYVDGVNLIGNAFIKRKIANVAIKVGVVKVNVYKPFPSFFSTPQMQLHNFTRLTTSLHDSPSACWYIFAVLHQT